MFVIGGVIMIQNWGESGIKKDGEEKCFLFTDLSNDPLEILIAKENKENTDKE